MGFLFKDDKVRRALREGALVIDCVDVSLTGTLRLGTPPQTIRGVASIHVNPDEAIVGRVVWAQGTHPFVNILRSQDVRLGQLLPAGYFFELEATDVHGTVWKNPKVSVEFEPGKSHTVVVFQCAYLRAERPHASNRNFVGMLFPQELRIPLQAGSHYTEIRGGATWTGSKRDAFRAEVDGQTLTYRQDFADMPETSEVTVSAKDALPPYFESRLLETLRFMTATNASWILCEVVSNGIWITEVACAQAAQAGLVAPPLQGHGHAGAFAQMFEAYLRHACRQNSTDEVSNLSRTLGTLYGLQSVDLDAIALLVAVSVESMLKEEFPDTAPVPDEVRDEVKSVVTAVAKLTLTDSMHKRVKSALGNMTSVSPKDKLYALAAEGAFPVAQADAWGPLRNSRAHGTKTHADPDKLQLTLDQVHAVLGLLYRLTFMKIGYEGLFTDYGKPNWPDEIFVLPHSISALNRDQTAVHAFRQNLEGLPKTDIRDKVAALRCVIAALKAVYPDPSAAAGGSRIPASLAHLQSLISAAGEALAAQH